MFAPMKPRARALLASTIAAFLAVGGAAAVSAPAAAGAKPTIVVWSRFVDQDFSAARIVLAHSPGGQVRELTHSSDGVVDLDPQVSPNGKLVAFERDLPDGTGQLGIVGTDGSGERILDLGCTSPCGADLTPTWTPDGRHLVFTRVFGPFDQPNDSAASAVLWRTDLHGSTPRRVSQRGIDGVYEDYKASFRPDGDLIFVRVRNIDGHNALFRMHPNRTGLHQLTPWSLDADLPSVSPALAGPTRNLVVFETYGHGAPDGKVQRVATVPSNCGTVAECSRDITYLTSNREPVENFNPAWSPSGRTIGYVRFVPGDEATPPLGDIWTMNWDGSHKTPFSQSPLFEFRPAFGSAS
jgi:TolB protein